jgi:short-subunit dehydrogenase
MTIANTWLVLGASSAAARAFAREAARHGDNLLLAGRDAEDLERSAADARGRYGHKAEVLAFDATAFDHHAAVAAEARRRTDGRLNVFLAFGVMPEQGAMDADFQLARWTIDTNYTGAVSILSHLAPILEAQGGGRVVVLGSVAGDRGRLRNYLYGSTKAALHTYLQGLRARLGRAGVRVVTIKPGVLDTAMTWGLAKLPLMASPEVFARAAYRAAGYGPEVVYIPRAWQLIMTIIRAVPEAIFKKTNI